MNRRSFLLAAIASASLLLGCDDGVHNEETNKAAVDKKNRQTIVIGFVAKSQSNDVFRVAERGARDAAKDLGEKYNVNVTIDVRTPSEEDAVKQAEAISSLTNQRANAIIVSASEAATLKSAIDSAVDRGIPVMTFDSDVPESKRFATYACDDVASAKKLTDLLAKAMGEKGTIAILAGNESAPNLQRRVQGIRDQIKEKYPNMKILEPNGVFYHVETPEKAAEAVSQAMNANPNIEGWAMVGGWPLFTENALRWEPGKVKVISWDALPAQLSYVRDGHVDTLLAQDCYGWGYKTVDIVLEKVVNGKDPFSPLVLDPLTPVTKANVEEWSKNWDKWLPK
jgi:ribose transport system substrate-binding protein